MTRNHPFLSRDELLENHLPVFIQDLCNECGKSTTRKIIPAQESCAICVQRFYVGNYNAKREHNFNLKVKINVLGYNCLACGETFPSNSDLTNVPSCVPKDLSLGRMATPQPFKPSKVNIAIHPLLYREPSERSGNDPNLKSIRNKNVAKKNKSVDSLPLASYLPDFLNE